MVLQEPPKKGKRQVWH